MSASYSSQATASCARSLRTRRRSVDKITLTLNHIMDGLATDCSVCSFKQVCDEVEGMKELHFKKGEAPMKLD